MNMMTIKQASGLMHFKVSVKIPLHCSCVLLFMMCQVSTIRKTLRSRWDSEYLLAQWLKCLASTQKVVIQVPLEACFCFENIEGLTQVEKTITCTSEDVTPTIYNQTAVRHTSLGWCSFHADVSIATGTNTIQQTSK